MNPAFKGGLITNRSLVEDLYVRQEMSIRQVAKACGCSLRTAARWLMGHGIPTRNNREMSRRLDKKGSKNPNWKGASVCPTCGGRRNGGVECLVCRTRRWKGIGNPNFKGRAEIMMLVRAWAAKHWRPNVFARDDYRCSDCGDARGGNLHAHHLKPLYKIVHEVLVDFGVDARVLVTEKRFELAAMVCADPRVQDVSNGVTLCEGCHGLRHRGPGSLPGCLWHGAYNARMIADGFAVSYDGGKR